MSGVWQRPDWVSGSALEDTLSNVEGGVIPEQFGP